MDRWVDDVGVWRSLSLFLLSVSVALGVFATLAARRLQQKKWKKDGGPVPPLTHSDQTAA